MPFQISAGHKISARDLSQAMLLGGVEGQMEGNESPGVLLADVSKRWILPMRYLN